MHKILELEKQEFLYSLTPKDKKIVQKAIELYYDFMDYQEATKIKKAIDNKTMNTYQSDEVYTKLGLSDEAWVFRTSF